MKQSDITKVDELFSFLESQRQERKDIIADTSFMTFNHSDGISRLAIKFNGSLEEYALTTVAKHQLAARLQIPWYYYERMEADVPDLLVANVNRWLKYNNESRLIRTMGHKLRAFLSPKYRRIENLEVLEHVLDATTSNNDITPVSMAVTSSYMYIKFVCSTIQAEVNVGDIVKCGFSVVNSEIGLSSLQVHPLIYRLVCSNGLVVAQQGTTYRQVHRGLVRNARNYPYELIEGITEKDKETFASIRPLMKNALDAERFTAHVNALKSAREITFKENSEELIEIIGEQYRMTISEREMLLHHYLKENDHSVFGLVQATTRTSQDIHDYSRASDFEAIGGSILRDYVKPTKMLPAYQLVA